MAYPNSLYGQEAIVNDDSLMVQTVFDGLDFPTGMAFLGPDDILVIEKDEGTVKRIINGNLIEEPVLTVSNIATEVERGMIGIAVAKKESNNTSGMDTPTYVFLSYTERLKQQNTADTSIETEEAPIVAAKGDLRNSLYRYEFVDGKLVNPKLLLEIPADPGPAHNGGPIALDDKNNVYIVVGNLYSSTFNDKEVGPQTLSQNKQNDPPADGRGGILRVTPDGEVVNGKGILGDSHPLNKYYAYGIRNSFGLGFDPVTGYLWETENGAVNGDEINLVGPGFNLGFNKILGFASTNIASGSLDDLVTFGGKGKYSDPELVWFETVAPTSVAFYNSDKMGEEYENDMFVGSVGGNGRLFHFDLTDNREGIILPGRDTSENFVEEPEDIEENIFGENFEAITDIEVGPDKYMYILSKTPEGGKIYKILPSAS
jgi:glucose/arabinose dehydrogenase